MLHISVVGLRVLLESDRLDRGVPFEDGSGDTMHPVHDPTVTGEDDRMRQVNLLNELDMVDDSSHRGRIGRWVEPVNGVDLIDRRQVYLLDREGSGGSFSPDGRHVAALGFLTPPPITSETEMAVILIDVEAGTTSIVPGSLTTNRFSFPNVAWASDGEWLFIGPVIHEDADHVRLLAYRPGDETAYQVPVVIETEYYGMGAD